GTFLHVEHIELLSGIHQTIREALPEVGKPFYVRYVSTAPQQPAPQRWSYSLTQFGFPLIGALSRVHRLIDLFGPVKRVFCSQQVWSDAGEPLSDGQEYFGTVLCTAQLRFTSGLLAEVVYGKGQALWDGQRQFEVQGSQGRLRVGSGAGELLLANGTSRELRVGSRRGLFVRDTAAVLDSLQEPSGDCYVTVQQSLYALRVADAARRSAIARQPIVISA
ncbi:MAG: Gfo/Idh/MocA family oxidoreductase, partial [Cyanobacteria bacterium P01_A01_bin.135]